MNNYIKNITVSVKDAIEKIKCLKAEDSLVFPIFEPKIGISIDIAVSTPSKKEFNIIRIGDGEDRKISL